jgi:ADP-ribose pyrophosphatase YjhB (NUDIX family)
MNIHVKGSHCSYCGTKFLEQRNWPRQCLYCYNDTYSNPLPVVVMLLPVLASNPQNDGILIQQRGIEPGKNQWAFPSGYMDLGETWQQACAREVREEMGVETSENDYRLIGLEPNSDYSCLLIFTQYRNAIGEDNLRQSFHPNQEVLDYKIVQHSQELAFPTHTKWLRLYLSDSDQYESFLANKEV